jgi:hypothetical protein
MRTFEGNLKYGSVIKLINDPEKLWRLLVKENYLSINCPKGGKFLTEYPPELKKENLKKGKLCIVSFPDNILYYEVKK